MNFDDLVDAAAQINIDWLPWAVLLMGICVFAVIAWAVA